MERSSQNIVEEIKSIISQASGGALTTEEIKLQIPPPFMAETFDLACPAGFDLAKKQPQKKPLAWAQEVAGNIKHQDIQKAEARPPAFVNMTLSAEKLESALQEVIHLGSAVRRRPRSESAVTWACTARPSAADPGAPEALRRPLSETPESVLLEFCSANPTGPLHFGHARGSILADTLARIYTYLGTKVEREYYINDAGGQIEKLGLSLQARFQQIILGNTDYPFPEEGYQGSYITELARQLPATAASWKSEQFASYAQDKLLALIKKDLELISIRFDAWFKESSLYETGDVASTINLLKAKGCAEEKEGALWLKSETKSQQGEPAAGEKVLRRKDGRPTYLAGDLAYHRKKLERGFALCLNVWGSDHHGYMEPLKGGIKALGFDQERVGIILVQMVRLLRQGKPVTLSKRAGDYLTLGEIIQEVGPDALRFFLNSRTPTAQLDFDLDLAKKQGPENPVYLIEYAHARICSIIKEKVARGVVWPQENKERTANSLLETDHKTRLLIVLGALFSETLKTCIEHGSAHHLTNYLIQVARHFHGYYETHPILNLGPEQTALAWNRYQICLGVKNIIKRGLDLLGIEAPEKM